MPITDRKLTFTELLGLQADHNLADGHARHALTDAQLNVVEQLPSIFRHAYNLPQQAVEERFLESFFEAHGENTAALPPCILFYSASVAIHAVARLLATEARSVALLTPTFDNLHDLIVAQGIKVCPIEEHALVSIAEGRSLPDVGAIFLVLPNNPTGFQLSPGELFALAEAIAARNLLLIIDLSFRYFDRAKRDIYRILQRAGCRFVCIEDTGKSIPALDIKIGITVADTTTNPTLIDIAEDLLLNVSPFHLEFLRRLIEADDRSANLRTIQRNRATLAASLPALRLETAGINPTLSVDWLRAIDGGDYAARLQLALQEAGVVVLPGSPFYWDDPRRGNAYLRVALAREPNAFSNSIARAVEVAEGFSR
jgi:aspartate/methionine/tyrosine aminotransferase